MSPEAEAREIIATIRREVEAAADLMLSAAERSLHLLPALRAGEVSSIDKIEQLMLAMLEACAFQDLTGQRLSRLETMIAAAGLHNPTNDPLLNGPALTGQGLDQQAADAIFGLDL